MRLVEDQRVVRGESRAREQQGVVDDDDRGLVRALAVAAPKTALPVRPRRPEADVRIAREAVPEVLRHRDGQGRAVAGLRVARPLVEARERARRLVGDERRLGAQARQALDTQIVVRAHQHRKFQRQPQFPQDARHHRQIAAHELLLERPRVGRDEHAPGIAHRPERGGDQVGQGLAHARARLDDEAFLALERARHGGGHRLLRGARLPARQHARQRPRGPEDLVALHGRDDTNSAAEAAAARLGLVT